MKITMKVVTLKLTPIEIPVFRETQTLRGGYRETIQYADYSIRISKNLVISIFVTRDISHVFKNLFKILSRIIRYVRRLSNSNIRFRMEYWNINSSFKKNIFDEPISEKKLRLMGSQFNDAPGRENPIKYHIVSAEPCIDGFPLKVTFNGIDGHIRIFSGKFGHGTLGATNPSRMIKLINCWQEFVTYYNSNISNK